MRDDFLTWLKNVRSIALKQQQRKLVMLEGDSDWALSLFTSIHSWPKLIGPKNFQNCSNFLQTAE